MLFRIIVLAAVLLCSSRAYAKESIADSLVGEAWKLWKGNSVPAVEAMFQKALTLDPGCSRAQLGLALLYSLKSKHVESWKMYRKAFEAERNFYPYLFATWLNPRFGVHAEGERKEIAGILTGLSSDRLADETIRAQSCEILGGIHRELGDLKTSDSWYKKLNAISDWMLVGPFDNVSASGFDRVFPPESDFDTSKTYVCKNSSPGKWFRIAAVRPDFWIDFQCYFAYTDAVYYANTFVFSPERQSVQVRLGTSGSLKAFLNDELLISSFDETNNDLDTYIVSTELQQGWNRLLIKCGFSEISKCNFMARITGPDGTSINDLRISSSPQPYSHTPGANISLIPNFAEDFFKEQLRRNPDGYENYILLADCYLRNDKAIEAELILRQGLKRLPSCPAFLASMIEAYARGRKYDEMNQVIEQVLELDDGVPVVLSYKFERLLQQENFDEALGLLHKLDECDPQSELTYLSWISFYGKRKQLDKIIEVNREALNRYPHNWKFTYLETVVLIQTSQQYNQAIDLVNKFLKQQYTKVALLTLADYYLKSSKIDQWETTFNKLFDYDHCAPGWHHKMAEIYTSLQQYGKAEQSIKSAIGLCPNSSSYWSKLGDVYRSMRDNARAADAYRSALTFNPKDYGTRESLREIAGKKSIFANFDSFSTDSLIKTAPSPEAYPNDKGIILLDATRRVVYDRGASTSSHEILIKLFKSSGINDFKEYQIGYNPNTQQLIIERAVTIKKDGTQVKADTDRGYVVFKSLEPGDCIHLKWKLKDYNLGKLSDHFWDTQYFNGFYPVSHCRYSLLVPNGLTFSHRTQNMPDVPKKTVTEDGVVYEWTLDDEPSIRYERDMPGIDDIGKVLYVSSIPSWEYLVDWYTDLAQTKTRGSFEISEQVESLFAGMTSPTEDEKIQTIYNFITENIRYSSVSFRQSGLVPQKARDVLVNRIGDCKDVATLCIAMLNEVGMDARYVLVNTTYDGENRNALPALVFNHCIAAVKTQRGTRYLDLTANNYSAGSVPFGDVDAFSLRIAADSRSPGYLHKENFTTRSIYRVTMVNANKDNSVTITRSSTRTGGSAAVKRNQFRDRGEEEQIKILSESLGEDYPSVRVRAMSFSGLDEPVDTLRDEYEFEVPSYFTESGSYKFMRIPWADNAKADEALSYDKRDHQYNYWPTTDTLDERITIALPPGYTPVDLKATVRYSSTVADYQCRLKFSNGVLTGQRKMIHHKRVVTPVEYASFKSFYNDVVRSDNQQILLKRK